MEHINIYSGKKAISRIVASDTVKELDACLEPFRSIFAVVDRNVADKCPAISQLTSILKKHSSHIKFITPTEQTKTLEAVMDICAWLLENNADRDALILAVGGGITTDMAGFAASIYKRGVRFAFVPTTLLSQVDAAIGGKTGVNFDGYKNILGTITQPEFTYLCPELLESLPNRDFLSGAAEMIKTFIIEDNENYYDAIGLLTDMNMQYCSRVAEGEDEAEVWQYCIANYSSELVKLIHEAAKVKAGVVSRDQFEGGERRKLNLGHTFAHAIETLAHRRGGDVTHGEAVAMGMIQAAALSSKYAASDESWMEICDYSLYQRFEDDFLAVGLPINCPYKMADMAEIMCKDKKAEGGKIHFVLPAAVGDVRIVDLSVDEVTALMA